MSLKENFVILAIVTLIVLGAVIAIIKSNEDTQARLDRDIKAFESKLPKNVIVQNASLWGYSNDYDLKNEQTFLTTLNLYDITVVWRTQNGEYLKYSFVQDSIVYYFYLVQ